MRKYIDHNGDEFTDDEVRGHRLRDLNITRVDLVDRGAAQDAHIVFYKADSEYRSESESEYTMTYSEYEGLTKEDIADAVEQVGHERFAEDPFSYDSPEHAIAEVWEQDEGDIYLAYTQAPSVPEPAPVQKSLDQSVDELRGPDLVKDYLHRAITKRAELDLLDRRHFNKSMEERYFEIVHDTDDGRLVYDTMVSPAGQVPLSQVDSIQKSYGQQSQVEEAFDIARTWMRR